MTTPKETMTTSSSSELNPATPQKASGDSRDPLSAGFQRVPDDARLHLFWRIFGPAWTPQEIDAQLEAMRDAGVGGVMTCVTYPVALDDPAKGIKNQRYLSPEFLVVLRHAAEKAKSLGLRFGVCGGTGWPYGGPTVSLSDSAQRLRKEVVEPEPDGAGWKPPILREGDRIVAVFLDGRDVSALFNEERDSDDRSPFIISGDADSRKSLEYFISGSTGMQVKRPAYGGEGYVVDHYSREAVTRYLKDAVAPLLDAAPGLIDTLFCDSLEVYRANWTGDFSDQFKTRRGYDLIPRLPSLFDPDDADYADLRFDFWRTAAELAEEALAKTIHEWSRERGVAFALEPYGNPPLGMTAGRYCDVPWGEQYEWNGFSFSRFTASCGHLAGKKIIGAEAWTWTGIPNRLIDSLSDLKLCGDLHFLSGENELTGMDFSYSPRSEGAPGWLPYFGPVMNPNNPQWLCFPELARYVGRCQHLLRQGRPVAEVALYVPVEDAMAEASGDQLLLDFELRDRLATGHRTDEFGLAKALAHRSDVIHALIAGGYDFDGIDFFAMNALARVEGDRLVAGDGRYSLVLLPNLTGMDLDALKKIARFCEEGGTLLATRRLPDRSYGVNREAKTRELRALIRDLFGEVSDSALSVHPYGKGRAIFSPDDKDTLAEAISHRIAPGPDVRMTPVQREVGFVHRQVESRDFYFLVNVGSSETAFDAEFRVGGKSAERWDPMTGEIVPLAGVATEDGRTRVRLNLPPRGSIFVRFAPGNPESSAEARPVRWIEKTLDVEWSIAFEGPDAPPSVVTRELASWDRWPGDAFYSGKATYRTTFEAPSASRCRLRFDAIHEVADAWVNDERAGAVWTPPLELEIGSLLQPGQNRLEIAVANLPVNRVLGSPEPDLRPLREIYGTRFPDPQEKKLMNDPALSGILGTVTLLLADE